MSDLPKPRPPFCPRALARCIGSKCALWVHETKTGGRHSIGLREPNERDTEPTGRGVCADNLRAVPWDDPAGVAS